MMEVVSKSPGCSERSSWPGVWGIPNFFFISLAAAGAEQEREKRVYARALHDSIVDLLIVRETCYYQR